LSGRPFLSQFVDEVNKTSNIAPSDPKYFFTEKYKIFSANAHPPFTKRVLILTRNLDREAGLIGAELWSRQIDYIRFNVDDIPDFASLTYSFDQKALEPSITFSIKGQKFRVSDISAVLLRQFEPKLANYGGNKLDRAFALEQWEAGLKILYRNLACNWLSDPVSTRDAFDRPRQLMLARSIGFDIPSTLITNDPVAARAFYHSHGRGIILKTLHHHGIEVAGKLYSMYTRRVSNQDIAKLDDLTYAPCILQERIIKSFELRVTVIGDQVFAARLGISDAESSRSQHQEVQDIHQLLSLSTSPDALISTYEGLSKSLKNRCIRLVGMLGLKYGAIDFIIDEIGRPIFLEVNPICDWYWIERKTGLPITKAMADLIEGLI
jgi:glutathione synthase/RimK-type ligase-like ATP-grasp enzyme